MSRADKPKKKPSVATLSSSPSQQPPPKKPANVVPPPSPEAKKTGAKVKKTIKDIGQITPSPAADLTAPKKSLPVSATAAAATSSPKSKKEKATSKSAAPQPAKQSEPLPITGSKPKEAESAKLKAPALPNKAKSAKTLNESVPESGKTPILRFAMPDQAPPTGNRKKSKVTEPEIPAATKAKGSKSKTARTKAGHVQMDLISDDPALPAGPKKRAKTASRAVLSEATGMLPEAPAPVAASVGGETVPQPAMSEPAVVQVPIPVAALPSMERERISIPYVPAILTVVEEPIQFPPFTLYVPPILMEGDSPVDPSGVYVTAQGTGEPEIATAPPRVSAKSESPVDHEVSRSVPVAFKTEAVARLEAPVSTPWAPPAWVPESIPVDRMESSAVPEWGENHLPPPESTVGRATPPNGDIWIHARDPYSLYVCWSFPGFELARYAKAVGGVWQVKVYSVGDFSTPHRVLNVPPVTDHLFAHLDFSGTTYVAEIGFLRDSGEWETHARSNRVTTPTTGIERASVELQKRGEEVAFPAGEISTVRFDHPTPSDSGTNSVSAPSSGSISSDAKASLWRLAGVEITPGGPNSADLAKDIFERVEVNAPNTEPTAGSSSIRNSEAGGLQQMGEIGPIVPGSLPPTSAARSREFWLRVNAELIVYGSTDKAAVVSVGGRPVKLRPDGSFSFRFALPDGEYPLPVTAVSPDGVETRSAALDFSRSTIYSGEVGTHPPDVQRQPPVPAAIA
ncbi:MAG TPA: DUF4912 domain-containing protein [Candidatus Limnocylindria bacterium]|nr:DUF4912 domain-containing protein [Candidatus Limnocylindria bacterium]